MVYGSFDIGVTAVVVPLLSAEGGTLTMPPPVEVVLAASEVEDIAPPTVLLGTSSASTTFAPSKSFANAFMFLPNV